LNDDPERKDGTGYGGAIDCDTASGSISISGCAFSRNVAWCGGAVDIYKTGSEATITDSSFSDNGNDNTRNGGALHLAASTAMRNCTLTGNRAKFGGAMRVRDHHVSIDGGSFNDNAASGNAGAISVGEKGKLEIGNEEPVTFQGNSAALYGGALEVESCRESVGNNIHNSVFKGNHAQWGGAVAAYGKSGKSTNMYFKDCTVEGNYATADGGAFYVEDESLIDLTRTALVENHADNVGGAVCIHGWKGVQAFRSSFTGNYAGSGGAVYAEGSGNKYSYLFIDECSFDANYITNRYGCTINVNGWTRSA
jgi:Chlamydia polymorphic membrane protein (Chlamydia_PMP).